MNILGARLKSLRKQKDLSQDEVARLTGYSRVQISNWEINRSEPDIQALSKLAAFFAVSIDYLTGKVSSPTDELVPITTEPLDPSATYMNDPASDEINDLLTLMSPEEKEAFRRLAQSVVNRQAKGVS